MSAATRVDIQAHAVAAEKSVADAGMVKDVITDIENDPDVKQGLQARLGPWLRQYGNSPIFCIATYLVAWEAKQYFQIDLDPQFTQYICGLLGLGAGYLYQKISIAWGKKQAPVQPAPPPAP